MTRAAALILILCACAPTAEQTRVSVSTAPGAAAYYPQAAGSRWEYLEPGELVETPRFFKEIVGETFVQDRQLTMTRFFGRGTSTTLFEDIGEAGAYLYREDRGDKVIVYDPPLQTLPEGGLQIGKSWQGDTTVTIFRHLEDTETSSLSYAYRVVESRRVKVAGIGEDRLIDVFVVSVQMRVPDGEASRVSTGEMWFAPHLGVVRTRQGLTLVDTNLRGL